MSKGTAIQRVQGMVCEVVLKESNADVLMSLRLHVHIHVQVYMYVQYVSDGKT